MRLGILQCDSVREHLQPRHGDYPQMFRRLLGGVDNDIEFRVYNLTRNEFPSSPDECDAWLITGSKWSVYDAREWIDKAHELVRELHAARRPIIGICFGHQLVCRALGGEVEKAEQGWGVGVHTTRILEQPDWMQPGVPTLSLIVSHQDQVTRVPAGTRHLATHEFCPYDMLQVDNHILTFQGHPEFRPEYSRDLMDMRREQIGEDTWQRGMASLATPIEDQTAASWIRHFIGQAAG